MWGYIDTSQVKCPVIVSLSEIQNHNSQEYLLEQEMFQHLLVCLMKMMVQRKWFEMHS